MAKTVGSDRKETEAKVAYEAECAAWRADGFQILSKEVLEKKNGCTVTYAIWKRAGVDPLAAELRVMVTESTDEESGLGMAFDWRSGAVCPLVGWGPVDSEHNVTTTGSLRDGDR